MNFVRLFPVIISFLLLSAHFSRVGISILSLIFLLLPFLLMIKKRWITNMFKIVLIIGSLEWLRTLIFYINQRQDLGEPYFRLVLIIGAVAIFTGLSTFAFSNEKVKDYFNI